MPPIKRPPRLSGLHPQAISPTTEIQKNLPRVPLIGNFEPALQIDDTAYTGGGNSQICSGLLKGKGIVCKQTLITPDMYVRLEERERIFERIILELGRHPRGILVPMLRCVSPFPHVINAGRGHYCEIYDRCIPFSIPENPKVQLGYLKIIVAALLDLHSIQIAHMDLKQANFMFKTNDSVHSTQTPVMIDWGEARLMDGSPDLPIVTSVGLIQRSLVMRSILDDPWIVEGTFTNLLIGMTPPKLYYLIDRIMLGIFISSSFFSFLRIKQLSDKLIHSSIAELIKYWKSLGKTEALFPHLKVFKDASSLDDWGDYKLERFLHDLQFDFHLQQYQ